MTDDGTPMVPASPAAKTIPVRGTKKSVPFKDAFRLQGSFTAAAERRALAWLAVRLPARVNSDHLTLVGFVAMFLAGASYALARTNRAGLILPLSAQGIYAGSILVFVLSLGFFITPALLGGGRVIMIAVLIEQQVRDVLNWSFASALASVLLVVTIAIYGLAQRATSERAGGAA